MSRTARPWGKWYWADWRSDPGLRMCGFAARGLWIDLLSLMGEADPYGYLLVNGKAPTAQQLAAMLGGAARQIEALLAELDVAGVPSRTAEGVLFSRRMVRDRAKEDQDRANGRGGGNPNLRPSAKGGVNPPHKAQKPEARSQKPDNPTPPSPPSRPRPSDAEPGDDGQCPAAVGGVTGIIRAFDEAGAEVYGPQFWSGHRPWPASQDHATATAMAEAGADPALCRPVFEALLRSCHAAGRTPPRSLAYAKGAVSDALAAAKQGLPPPRIGPGQASTAEEDFKRLMAGVQ